MTELLLTDAGLETVLLFHEGIDLPHFAAFPLLESDAGRAALRRYYEPFLRLADERGVGLLLSTPTWRANADWGALLGYDADALASVNREAVSFLEELRAGRDAVIVEGCVGPRGDAYRPTSLMSADEAERYHAPQLRAFAESGCARATALTLTYVDEAVGIVRAAVSAGVPIVVGFTVETDGRLPSGVSLEDAVAAVDEATAGAALGFMINCAHPTHVAHALPKGRTRDRIHGLRANASTKSHEELDASETLDDGDPADLAARSVGLRAQLPALRVLGGCCGTDIRHVTAICDAWTAAAN
jgi:homocysteine S-methyltransferase